MLSPSGEQFEIAFAEQRAVAVEVGGGLRTYAATGQDVIDGYGVDEMATGGRGQMLIPWPNRLQDGSYEFDGRRHQLPLTESEHSNAIHGLVRWVAWHAREHEPHRVVLGHVLHPQPGYPFSLDLQIEYELSASGLTVRTTATNIGAATCPYGSGAHPYLTLGTRDDRRRGAPGAGANGAALRRPGYPDRHGRGRRHRARLPLGASRSARRSSTTATPTSSATTTGVARDHARGRRSGPDALGRRGLSVRHGVHGRHPVRATSRTRGRADDLSSERVPQRRRSGDARAGRVAHRIVGAFADDRGERMRRRCCVSR